MSQSDYDGGGSPERSGDGGGEVALRKGPWTKEEDEILMNYVKEKGIAKWCLIGKQTGLARSGKSCRLRWLNHLRPNLKKGCFTKEEQNLILQLHSQYGNKWTRIASKLPGRTDNEIKNFWNTRVKRCNKRQLPLYSETMEEEDHSPVIKACCNFNSNFCIDNLDKNSTHLYQILQSTSCAPAQTHLMSYSWSLQQLQSPTYLPTQYFHSTSVDSSVKDPLSQQPPITSHSFPSKTRCISAQQPTSSFRQRPPSSSGYLSSLQQSRPLYQSMQDLCSCPTKQPPTWISSLQKDDESSLAKHSFISHSTHPLIKPPLRSSTDCQLSLMPSLDSEHFRHFRRLGGKLPRPLSAPLMSSILNSKEAFSSTFWLKSLNHSSSVSPLNMSSTTQTPTGPTFQLNFPTVGSSDLSLHTSPLSVDMTGPLVSRSFNEPVSPGLSSISNMEPPSIQTFSSPVIKYSSVTSLSQLNAQSMTNYDLLNAKLQEELANGSWQSSRKDNFSGQNLVEENLLTKHVKTVDSLDDILCKESMSDEISRTEYINDEYSRKYGILTQSFKTSDSLSSSFDTTNPSSKIRRRKEFMISRERSSLCTQVTNREDIYSETSETAYIRDNILRNDNTISENLEGKNSEREVSSSRLDVDNAILKGDSKNNDLLVKDTGSKDILETWLTESLWSEELDYTKCIKKEDPLLVESFNLEGDFNLELRDYLFEEGSKRTVITDPSMSDVQSLIKNSEKQILSTSNKQYPVEDEADLFSGQIYKSFPLESGGGDINSSSIRHSTENVEAEDDINNEISNLLENYPVATEIPEWYQTSRKELPAATQHSDEFNNNV